MYDVTALNCSRAKLLNIPFYFINIFDQFKRIESLFGEKLSKNILENFLGCQCHKLRRSGKMGDIDVHADEVHPFNWLKFAEILEKKKRF